MKRVVQGQEIKLRVIFYNIEPSQGGVPTDPDGYLNTWIVHNDAHNHVSRIEFWLNGVFAPGEYYFSIIDNTTDFEVFGYLTDAERIAAVPGTELVKTGPLPYGVYDSFEFISVNPAYSGKISITFPSSHGGVSENFEIENTGQSEPTYQIWDENNTLVVDVTIFPLRIGTGTYETTYAVAEDAVPGENWHIVSRGKIGGADTFLRENFTVVDKAVATDEAARLISLSEAKTYLEIQTVSNDEFILSLLDAASKVVEEYTGVNYHVETVVEYVDGENRDALHLDKGPIFEILKIEFRDAQAWFEIEKTRFEGHGFFLYRVDGDVFQEGRKNWRITYEAGYDKADRQIRTAVKMLVRYWYHTKNRTGILSDVVGGGLRVNYQEIEADLPPEVQAILKSHRRFK